MIPNDCSQAPTHITPPTGAFEVYEFNASTNTAALVGSYGEDVAAAHKAMRRAGNSACIARGGVATTLKGTTPPSHGVRLKAAVKLAWTLANASPEPVTPRPVEPAAAPVALPKPAEEPMPTEETPVCEGHDCKELRAGVRSDTQPALVPFCRRDRKRVLDTMRYGHVTIEEAAQAIRDGVSSRTPKAAPKPSKKAAPKPSKPAPTSATKRTAAVAVNHPAKPEASATAIPAADLGACAFAAKVNATLDGIGTMLIAKNKAYGNSALAPVRVFSRASTEEQLLVRIDDKLSRLARGEAAGEDVVRDLIGYLTLLLIARSAA